MAEDGEKDTAKPTVDPAALTVEQLAKMLQIPAENVRDHLAAGAPTPRRWARC